MNGWFWLAVLSATVVVVILVAYVAGWFSTRLEATERNGRMYEAIEQYRKAGLRVEQFVVDPHGNIQVTRTSTIGRKDGQTNPGENDVNANKIGATLHNGKEAAQGFTFEFPTEESARARRSPGCRIGRSTAACPRFGSAVRSAMRPTRAPRGRRKPTSARRCRIRSTCCAR